ncbi:cupin domain-containing protein [Belnapia rosea]|jgi:quercetin dioxygenase-like cupin family protein|uniref:Cupin domain-containing protein n=1 Tax=Belnapia rosea TaxID=938405 RepID=A0A1G6L6V6_9PROT|nr:cupin domain-containing protein [Belnapia rosea]SDB70492.1 Cupin domain-containing protein [Belnapia rosea]SDC38911.1 Cupin domain-containing protein [Belnapia rosea]
MTDTPARLVIRQPGEGPSYWQPVPANGFVRCLLDPTVTGAETPFAMGTQTVDPGCHVREHLHDANEEVILVQEGSGEAHVEGEVHPMRPGTCFFFPRNRPHSFHNTGEGPLTFLWLILPHGLESFFARIGRSRAEGDAPPAPFPRPENVLQIEAETVFGRLPA